MLRDRIGAGEDRFFATVFLGSGLLFVAMFFVSGAMAAGLISTAADASSAGRLGSLWPFGRRSTASLASVYGLRMAAVFTISATTLATRLRLVPRWLAVLGYATAACCSSASVSCRGSNWSFPAGCSRVSLHILITTFRADEPSLPGDSRRNR